MARSSRAKSRNKPCLRWSRGTGAGATIRNRARGPRHRAASWSCGVTRRASILMRADYTQGTRNRPSIPAAVDAITTTTLGAGTRPQPKQRGQPRSRYPRAMVSTYRSLRSSANCPMLSKAEASNIERASLRRASRICPFSRNPHTAASTSASAAMRTLCMPAVRVLCSSAATTGPAGPSSAETATSRCNVKATGLSAANTPRPIGSLYSRWASGGRDAASSTLARSILSHNAEEPHTLFRGRLPPASIS
jgi:hypothetical protein